VSVKPGTAPEHLEHPWNTPGTARNNPGTPQEQPIIPGTSHNALKYPQYSQEHS